MEIISPGNCPIAGNDTLRLYASEIPFFQTFKCLFPGFSRQSKSVRRPFFDSKKFLPCIAGSSDSCPKRYSCSYKKPLVHVKQKALILLFE
jgi:hypothetical protein